MSGFEGEFLLSLEFCLRFVNVAAWVALLTRPWTRLLSAEAEEQMMEAEALESILGDEFKLLSAAPYHFAISLAPHPAGDGIENHGTQFEAPWDAHVRPKPRVPTY
jgi:hypothetical protein